MNVIMTTSNVVLQRITRDRFTGASFSVVANDIRHRLGLRATGVGADVAGSRVCSAYIFSAADFIGQAISPAVLRSIQVDYPPRRRRAFSQLAADAAP